jgi:predicted amidohydrolase YtcJ
MAGKTIIPGLIDGHFHFMPTCALRQIAIKVSDIVDGVMVPTCIEDVGKKLKEISSEMNSSLPIICYSYVIASIQEDRLPFRQEIDAWFPGCTVIILSMDGHSSAYSTAALKKMGISEEGHNGILSGEDHEFNMGRINNLLLDSLTLPTLAKSMQLVVNDALSYGITGIHCMEGFEDAKEDKALDFFMRFAGILPIRVRTYIQYKEVARALKYVPRMTRPRIGGCGSWEVDGAIGSRTAAFDESYADDPNCFGKTYYDPMQLTEMLRATEGYGFQTSSHAIGTRGIEQILQAYETVGTSADLRARIEHFEFPNEDQTRRAIQDMHLVISVQPGYTWIDSKYQKSYDKYLRPEQYNRQIPLKTISEMGGILCGSSDSPVQHLNPFLQMQGMVNYPLEEQRLSVYQALRTYTYNGAFATFEEADRGTLAIGKIADFAVLNHDPFTIDKDKIIELKAEQTFIDGKLARQMNMGTLEFLVKGFLHRHKI